MRDQILSAATRLMAVSGFSATSIQAVAEEVGIRKQSLLYYFPTKSTLREAVLEGVLAHWKDVVPRALVEATSGRTRFESALRIVIDFFLEDRNRALVVIREILDRPKEMKALLRAHLQPWMGLITDYIRKGQTRGEVRAEVDPEAYVIESTVLAINMVAAVDVLRAVFPEDTPRKEAQSRLLNEVARLTSAGLFVDE